MCVGLSKRRNVATSEWWDVGLSLCRTVATFFLRISDYRHLGIVTRRTVGVSDYRGQPGIYYQKSPQNAQSSNSRPTLKKCLDSNATFIDLLYIVLMNKIIIVLLYHSVQCSAQMFAYRRNIYIGHES